MKRVVLFDFHNTLATCDGWLELEIRTLPAMVLRWLFEHGYIPPPGPSSEQIESANRLFQELRQGVRDSGLELSAVEGAGRVLSRLGVHPPAPAIADAVQELEYACLPEVEMMPGADVALQRLRDAGYRLGVVSSAGYPPFVELALEKIGLRPFFSEVITSAGEGLYKSNPELFRRAVRKLGATPDEAVHVGDHAIYDVVAARAAGLAVIWFAAPHARRTAHLHGVSWEQAAAHGAGADAVVTGMDQVFDAVSHLN